MKIDVTKISNALPQMSPDAIFAIARKAYLISEEDIYYISSSDKELLASQIANRLGKNTAKGEYVQSRYARDFAIAYKHFSSIFLKVIMPILAIWRSLCFPMDIKKSRTLVIAETCT